MLRFELFANDANLFNWVTFLLFHYIIMQSPVYNGQQVI